jgi:hypothetical protein
MNVTITEVVLGLNVMWIAGFTFFWRADSKTKTDNIKECVREKDCKERMKALILQEDLKADACQEGVGSDIKNIKEDVEKLKVFYGNHKHSKESGKVEGGEII